MQHTQPLFVGDVACPGMCRCAVLLWLGIVCLCLPYVRTYIQAGAGGSVDIVFLAQMAAGRLASYVLFRIQGVAVRALLSCVGLLSQPFFAGLHPWLVSELLQGTALAMWFDAFPSTHILFPFHELLRCSALMAVQCRGLVRFGVLCFAPHSRCCSHQRVFTRPGQMAAPAHPLSCHS